jgi:large subunit ribosomal protein L15
MDLKAVQSGVHKLKRKKRVGRGPGSGHGKTGSRGAKGQYASAGAKLFSSLFEGGQMPLYRRSPKRGFSNETWRKARLEFNVGDIDKHFQKGDEVSAESLKEKNILNGSAKMLRVLGEGEIAKAVTVKAHHFTKSAKEKIEKAGGKCELLPPAKKPVRNKMKPRPPKSE